MDYDLCSAYEKTRRTSPTSATPSVEKQQSGHVVLNARCRKFNCRPPRYLALNRLTRALLCCVVANSIAELSRDVATRHVQYSTARCQFEIASLLKVNDVQHLCLKFTCVAQSKSIIGQSTDETSCEGLPMLSVDTRKASMKFENDLTQSASYDTTKWTENQEQQYCTVLHTTQKKPVHHLEIPSLMPLPVSGECFSFCWVSTKIFLNGKASHEVRGNDAHNSQMTPTYVLQKSVKRNKVISYTKTAKGS